MTPAGTSNELDVQNGWEGNTHTHTQMYNIFTLLNCFFFVFQNQGLCEVGATERGCSGSIGSDDTRGYGAGSGDVGKELPRGMIP